jgi:TolB-like protein/class 3 adenylate cyclase
LKREQRKFAAILAADVAGYSRLMGRDESGTLVRLKQHRRERLEPALARNGGRLVKLAGDGALAEFGSAVDALRTAIEFQQAVAEANWDQPADNRIVFRIGLHVGDLIVDGNDLYGDGVNIAARLEAAAPEGGIVVSRTVQEAVEGRLKAALHSLGLLSLKNIERPVLAFRVAWNPGDWPASGPSAVSETSVLADQVLPALTLPDRPSIAVLPFQNMTGDPAQDYFADGIVEDIITALSRFKSLFVIARNSSFTYKGKAVDIRQVARELGVHYVLEGSVRKAGDRVRITGQLIEGSTSSHLWADRFDGLLEDIFELQDEVATTVAGLVGAKVEEVEVERARRRPAEHSGAHDCFLRGLAMFQSRTRADLEEARRLFYRAIELDPNFSTPYGWAARCYSTGKLQGFVEDSEWEEQEVRRLASIVWDIGRDDAVALAWTGFALFWVCQDFAAGSSFVDKAIAINPNLTVGWQARGFLSMNLGEHATALEQFARATRLSPVGPDLYLARGYSALCWFFLGKDDEAARCAIDAVNHLPGWVGGLLASSVAHAFLGNRAEASASLAKLRGLRPDLRLSNLRALFVFRRPEDWTRLFEGLRLAGLPE